MMDKNNKINARLEDLAKDLDFYYALYIIFIFDIAYNTGSLLYFSKKNNIFYLSFKNAMI